MPGVLTIAKKEFVDHVTDHTFLLSFGVLLIVMAAGAYSYVYEAQDWAYQETLRGHAVEEGQVWKTNQHGFTNNIAQPLASLGVFVATVLSFNSINRERREGSFKILLSYPIRRSEVVLGKLLGGAITVTLVAVASMTISFAIVMYYLSIPATSDFLLRFTTVTGLGILLLFFYLCLGTALSSVVRDTTVALIGILLLATILRFESISMMLVTLSGVAYYLGYEFKIPEDLRYGVGRFFYFNTATRDYWITSPFEAFIGFSSEIFRFQNPVFNPPKYIPIEYEWLLVRNLDLVWSITLFAAIAFVACFVLIWRRDIS
jgi:ABC-2 type transport system permease protein